MLLRRLVGLIAGLSLLAQATTAQYDPWQRLSALRAGREVTVETLQPKRKLKGTFVGHYADGITVQLRSGGSETVARAQVRKITAKRPGYRHAPLIGALAGGAILGGLAARPKMDFTAWAIVVFALIGAGLGALAGWGVRAAGNDEVVYDVRKG